MTQPAEVRPKVRRLRPPWTLKPGSRAAWVRGCRCSYVDNIMHQTGTHGDHCPLAQMKAEFEKRQSALDNGPLGQSL